MSISQGSKVGSSILEWYLHLMNEKQKILLFMPSRPVSRNQFCRLMVGFRLDVHIYNIYELLQVFTGVVMVPIVHAVLPSHNHNCELVHVFFEHLASALHLLRTVNSLFFIVEIFSDAHVVRKFVTRILFHYKKKISNEILSHSYI